MEFASVVSSRVCDCLSEVLFVSCVVELGTAAPMRSFAQAASTEEIVVPSRVVQIDGLVCVLFYVLALGLGFQRDEMFHANGDVGEKLLSLFKEKSFVCWQVYDGSSNGLYLFGECLFRWRWRLSSIARSVCLRSSLDSSWDWILVAFWKSPTAFSSRYGHPPNYQSPICICIITSLVASPELAKNHLVRALLFLCHQLLCQSSVLRSISGQFRQSLLCSADESGFHEMASEKQVFLAQVISGLSGERGLCFTSLWPWYQCLCLCSFLHCQPSFQAGKFHWDISHCEVELHRLRNKCLGWVCRCSAWKISWVLGQFEAIVSTWKWRQPHMGEFQVWWFW